MISEIFKWIFIVCLGILSLGIVGLLNVVTYDLITKGDIYGSVFMGLVSLALDSAIIFGLTSNQ